MQGIIQTAIKSIQSRGIRVIDGDELLECNDDSSLLSASYAWIFPISDKSENDKKCIVTSPSVYFDDETRCKNLLRAKRYFKRQGWQS